MAQEIFAYDLHESFKQLINLANVYKDLKFPITLKGLMMGPDPYEVYPTGDIDGDMKKNHPRLMQYVKLEKEIEYEVFVQGLKDYFNELFEKFEGVFLENNIESIWPLDKVPTYLSIIVFDTNNKEIANIICSCNGVDFEFLSDYLR